MNPQHCPSSEVGHSGGGSLKAGPALGRGQWQGGKTEALRGPLGRLCPESKVKHSYLPASHARNTLIPRPQGTSGPTHPSSTGSW